MSHQGNKSVCQERFTVWIFFQLAIVPLIQKRNLLSFALCLYILKYTVIFVCSLIWYIMLNRNIITYLGYHITVIHDLCNVTYYTFGFFYMLCDGLFLVCVRKENDIFLGWEKGTGKKWGKSKKKGGTDLSLEEMKKQAAVQCLRSASDEVSFLLLGSCNSAVVQLFIMTQLRF